MNKGIYAIICKTNGKMYIGYSLNFKTRKKTHWAKMTKNLYLKANEQLQLDWNSYGKENFKFVVIEEMNIDSINELLQKEEDYIVRFGTFFEDRGYNISLPVSKKYRQSFIKEFGEEFLRGLVYSNDDLLLQKDWKQKNNNLKRVYQIDKSNGIVRVWDSRQEIKEELKLSEKCLRKFTFGAKRYDKKKSFTKTFKGFVWVLEDKYDCLFDYSLLFIPKKRKKEYKPMKAQISKMDRNLQKKPISLRNMESNDIWNFESQSQAERILGFKLQPLIQGFKQKGGGKKVNVTQWKGWKIYNPLPVNA